MHLKLRIILSSNKKKAIPIMTKQNLPKSDLINEFDLLEW